MNNIIKGSIAGATGVALLMGGFGTYALWTDTADLPSSSVTSGELTINPSASDPVWADETPGGEWTAGDPIVPGDVVRRTQTFDITGTGANLEGVITFAEGVLSGGAGDDDNTDNVTVDVVVTSDDLNAVVVPNAATADPNDFKFADPFGSTTLTTVVTYTFDGTETGATGTTDQLDTWTLPVSTFTITQN